MQPQSPVPSIEVAFCCTILHSSPFNPHTRFLEHSAWWILQDPQQNVNDAHPTTRQSQGSNLQPSVQNGGAQPTVLGTWCLWRKNNFACNKNEHYWAQKHMPCSHLPQISSKMFIFVIDFTSVLKNLIRINCMFNRIGLFGLGAANWH